MDFVDKLSFKDLIGVIPRFLQDINTQTQCFSQIIDKISSESLHDDQIIQLLKVSSRNIAIKDREVLKLITNLLSIVSNPSIIIPEVEAFISEYNYMDIPIVVSKYLDIVDEDRDLLVCVIGSLGDLTSRYTSYLPSNESISSTKYLSSISKELVLLKSRVFDLCKSALTLVNEDNLPTIVRTLLYSLTNDTYIEGINELRKATSTFSAIQLAPILNVIFSSLKISFSIRNFVLQSISIIPKASLLDLLILIMLLKSPNIKEVNMVWNVIDKALENNIIDLKHLRLLFLTSSEIDIVNPYRNSLITILEHLFNSENRVLIDWASELATICFFKFHDLRNSILHVLISHSVMKFHSSYFHNDQKMEKSNKLIRRSWKFWKFSMCSIVTICTQFDRIACDYSSILEDSLLMLTYDHKSKIQECGLEIQNLLFAQVLSFCLVHLSKAKESIKNTLMILVQKLTSSGYPWSQVCGVILANHLLAHTNFSSAEDAQLLIDQVMKTSFACRPEVRIHIYDFINRHHLLFDKQLVEKILFDLVLPSIQLMGILTNFNETIINEDDMLRVTPALISANNNTIEEMCWNLSTFSDWELKNLNQGYTYSTTHNEYLIRCFTTLSSYFEKEKWISHARSPIFHSENWDNFLDFGPDSSSFKSLFSAKDKQKIQALLLNCKFGYLITNLIAETLLELKQKLNNSNEKLSLEELAYKRLVQAVEYYDLWQDFNFDGKKPKVDRRRTILPKHIFSLLARPITKFTNLHVEKQLIEDLYHHISEHLIIPKPGNHGKHEIVAQFPHSDIFDFCSASNSINFITDHLYHITDQYHTDINSLVYREGAFGTGRVTLFHNLIHSVSNLLYTLFEKLKIWSKDILGDSASQEIGNNPKFELIQLICLVFLHLLSFSKQTPTMFKEMVCCFSQSHPTSISAHQFAEAHKRICLEFEQLFKDVNSAFIHENRSSLSFTLLNILYELYEGVGQQENVTSFILEFLKSEDSRLSETQGPKLDSSSNFINFPQNFWFWNSTPFLEHVVFDSKKSLFSSRQFVVSLVDLLYLSSEPKAYSLFLDEFIPALYEFSFVADSHSIHTVWKSISMQTLPTLTTYLLRQSITLLGTLNDNNGIDILNLDKFLPKKQKKGHEWPVLSIIEHLLRSVSQLIETYVSSLSQLPLTSSIGLSPLMQTFTKLGIILQPLLDSVITWRSYHGTRDQSENTKQYSVTALAPTFDLSVDIIFKIKSLLSILKTQTDLIQPYIPFGKAELRLIPSMTRSIEKLTDAVVIKVKKHHIPMKNVPFLSYMNPKNDVREANNVLEEYEEKWINIITEGGISRQPSDRQETSLNLSTEHPPETAPQTNVLIPRRIKPRMLEPTSKGFSQNSFNTRIEHPPRKVKNHVDDDDADDEYDKYFYDDEWQPSFSDESDEEYDLSSATSDEFLESSLDDEILDEQDSKRSRTKRQREDTMFFIDENEEGNEKEEEFQPEPTKKRKFRKGEDQKFPHK